MIGGSENNKRLLLLASVAIGRVLGAGLPRGVAPEDAKLYTPSTENTFKCITDTSINIPFSAVNDDYCDCPDGSDEPGTSACAYIPHAKLYGRGFYCANKGHTAGYLPLNRINDGICDYEFCCDGSDEYNNAGGVKCENRCKDIGQKVRKLLAEKWKVRNEGGRKKKELIKKAQDIKRETQANINRLQSQIGGLEERVKKLEEEVKVVEEEESRKIVKSSRAGGKVSIVIEVARGRVDELRTALEKVREAERDAKDKLEEVEGILKGLKDTYNPNFNDEGVKTAVRKWDDYVAAGKIIGQAEVDSAAENEIDELITGPQLDWEELASGEGTMEDDVAKLYKFEEYLPGSIREWAHQKLEDFRKILVKNGILAERTESSGPEPKAVTDAKAKVQSANSELNNVRMKLKTAQEELGKEYGPDDIFRALKGTCISRDIGEYKYEYCFMEKAYQKSLKDSGSTFLGDHKRIDIIEESSTKEGGVFPPDDILEQHEEKLVGWTLLNENGARCWNGPARSAKIELYCATENEVRSVVEEEKCVYKFEVGTPAVCEGEEGAQEKVAQEVRDEL